MSQEKVDKYKKEKANRQKILKKERIKHRLEIAAVALVCLLAVGWVGYSIYDNVSSQVKEAIEVDNSAVDNYVNNLSS